MLLIIATNSRIILFMQIKQDVYIVVFFNHIEQNIIEKSKARVNNIVSKN